MNKVCETEPPVYRPYPIRLESQIGPLHDPVTWYGINYAWTQITQWDFQNKRTLSSPARLSFVLKVPLRFLRPSVIYFVPCDRIPAKGLLFADVITKTAIPSTFKILSVGPGFELTTSLSAGRRSSN